MMRATGHFGPKRGRRGITLVEATLSVMIAGIMLAAALHALGAAARRHQTRNDREIALGLAHELMSEILQGYYTDPEIAAAAAPATFGPEPDELTVPGVRAAFDDLDDYHGWLEMPPRASDGTPLPNLDGFGRGAAVFHVDPDYIDGSGGIDPAQDTGLRRITVIAGRPDGVQVRIEALRGIHGSYDLEPSVESTTVRRVGVELQLGEEGTPLFAGTTILNQSMLGDAP